MKCMRCNHALPDDSVFCQYCGNRIENTDVTPGAAETKLVDEAATAEASDVSVKDDVVIWTNGETLSKSAEEVSPPPPAFGNMEPDEALKTKVRVCEQEMIGVMNTNSQSQPGQESEMYVDHGSKKIRKTKNAKQPKKKYCSNCGTQMDQQTKQCPICGKKYFKGIRFHKVSVAITVLSLVIVALIGLNVFQFVINSWNNEELHKKNISIENLQLENENLEGKNEELLEEKEDLEREITELKATIQSQRLEICNGDSAIERLRGEISEYKPLVQFCKAHVEIIADDDTDLYHKFGCRFLDTSLGFLVLNTEAAESRGYKRCPYCLYTQGLV